MIAQIQDHIRQSLETKQALLDSDAFQKNLAEAAFLCRQALSDGRKILLAGNGGSAADAQHIAAELVGRFEKEREALPGIALTTDTSALTAIANDYGYEEVFNRQVAGLGQQGDVFIGISTSGNSANIIKATEKAREMGLHTIAMTGSGGKLQTLADVTLAVPSHRTANIQECHILAGHILCALIDE